MSLVQKISKVSIPKMLIMGLSVFLLLNLIVEWKAEAVLRLDEVFTAGDSLSEDQLLTESHFDFGNRSDWEKRIFPETFSSFHISKDLFSPPQPSRLHLKSPGVLPGIEFGIEMHSLQAFQSVVPSETLTKGLDLRQDRPLLVPPSINAPDYNGGFLRFTW